MIRRMKRCGFLPESEPTAETIAREAGNKLFRAIDGNMAHVLRGLLPKKSVTSDPVITSTHSQ